MKKETIFSVLGTFLYKKEIYLLVRQKDSKTRCSLKKQTSKNIFEIFHKDIRIAKGDKGDEYENISFCKEFRFSDISERGKIVFV